MTDTMGDYRALMRGIAWDMINHDQMYDPEIQQRLGLSPASPDVLDMEHAASDDRLELLTPLSMRLVALCTVASAIAHRAMHVYVEEDMLDPGMLAIVGTISSNLVAAVLAHLAAEGAITVPGDSSV